MPLASRGARPGKAGWGVGVAAEIFTVRVGRGIPAGTTEATPSGKVCVWLRGFGSLK